jgi:hypothetical protein
MDYSLDESIKMLTENMANIQPTPEQCGIAMKKFKEVLDDFINLPDEEKHKFYVEFFSNPDNLDATESFALRHPDAYYNKYIQKEI